MRKNRPLRAIARNVLTVALLAWPSGGDVQAADGPTHEQAAQALRRAVNFFREKVADHGGYVYRVSGDLAIREGEGKAPPGTDWVQPPGTPTVGEAYLVAFEATGDPYYKEAARETAMALVRGQLHSGGWDYRIEFNPEDREKIRYRVGPDGKQTPDPTPSKALRDPGGWDVWKHRKVKGNVTTLDDDTTQAATRFLVRADRAFDFQDKEIHEAATYALKSLQQSQYPNGGWSANYDRFPEVSPSADHYPVIPAAYPESWSRTWPKDFTGCYVLNDNLVADMIATMLLAHEVYDDDAFLTSARQAGAFLILAQMPDPQPAWAQQYNRDMQPDWSRKFEPPAVSGGESQNVMRALMALYRRTGDAKYLEPIPRALDYLRRSQLPDGRLARFYELRTNRPLYFTKDYQLTYNSDDMPTHYGFIVGSNLDAIEAEYRRLKESGPTDTDPGSRKRSRPRLTSDLEAKTRAILDALDDRGAWVEHHRMTAHKVEPASGVIESQTFAKNVATLSRYLEATAD